MTDNIPTTNWRALLLLLLHKRTRLKVVGNSMLPLLHPGEEVLINPHAYRHTQPQIDDIVVLAHPHERQLTIIKRVTAIEADNQYFLSGDNPASSTDSRHWGTVSQAKILGKVTHLFR